MYAEIIIRTMHLQLSFVGLVEMKVKEIIRNPTIILKTCLFLLHDGRGCGPVAFGDPNSAA